MAKEETEKYNNVLFICSGRQEDLILQQNCVFIQQFIEFVRNNAENTFNSLLDSDIFYKHSLQANTDKKNFSKKYNKTSFFVLTDTDLLKSVLDDNVNIIYDKITFDNIRKILKQYNINTIVPAYGDKLIDDIFTNEYFMQQQKYDVFFNSIYSGNYNQRYFNKIAKLSGFSVCKRTKIINNERYRTFSIVAIDDLLGNQIVLDTISTAKRNEKSLFVSPIVNTNIQTVLQQKILCLCKNMSSLLDVRGVIYCVRGFVDDKDKVVFQDLQYGFSEETVFTIQKQKVDIIELMSSIATKKIAYYDICRTFYTYSYNYRDTKQIFYAKNLNENIKLIDNTAIQVNQVRITNRRLCCIFESNFGDVVREEGKKETKFQSMIDAAKDGFIISNNDNVLKQYYSAFKIKGQEDIFVNIPANEDNCCYHKNGLVKVVDKYMLVIYQPSVGSQKQNENNSDDVFFIRTCQQLALKTDKQVILVSTVMPPFLMLMDYKHVFMLPDIDENTIRNIINHFNIKKVMLKSIQGNTAIVNTVKKCGACIYGINYDCPAIYNKEPQTYISLCEKLGIQYSMSIDNHDQLFEFYCISDGKNNFFAKTIAYRQVYGCINTNVLCFSGFFTNFSLEEQINEITEKILQNIKIRGLVCISYKYSDGIVSLININTEITSALFYCRKEMEQNLFFEVLIKSLTGNHNIELESRKFEIQTQQKDIFYKRFIFQVDKKNTITLDGYTKKKIFERFLYLSKKKA